MTQKTKPVVVAVAPAYREYAEENKVLAPLGIEVKEVVTHGDKEKLKDALKNVDIIFLRDTQLDGETLNELTRCQGIIRYGVGFDNIDLKTATAKKIMIANVPDYGAEIEVSDHAAALTLSLLRRIPSRHRKVSQQGLWKIDQEEPIMRIGQRVLGLIGFGKIAQNYLSRMKAFGIQKVLIFDPYISDETARSVGAEKVDIDTLCKTANLISLHAPATPETKHIINKKTLALMGKDTAIINTSRGALVDEVALVETLKSGAIFGAALDVQEKEPMPTDSPLHAIKDLDNVILTNHMGWYSDASIAILQRKAGEQAYQILSTGKPSNWVNPW